MLGSGPNDDESVLPATVIAAHLETCAAELAGGPSVGSVGDVAAVLAHVVAGQQHLSAMLARLADYVGDRRPAAPSPDLLALTEVLRAASAAAGYSADALAEGRPALESLVRSAGEDTRL